MRSWFLALWEFGSGPVCLCESGAPVASPAPRAPVLDCAPHHRSRSAFNGLRRPEGMIWPSRWTNWGRSSRSIWDRWLVR